MIVDHIKNFREYPLADKFVEAFEFIDSLESDAEEKRYVLNNGIYAVVESYMTKNWSEGKFESHRKYIDIQYLLSGTEFIDYSNISTLTPLSEYDPERDIIFYKSPANIAGGRITLESGVFALFFPQDGHMPQLAAPENTPAKVKKVVVKIPV